MKIAIFGCGIIANRIASSIKLVKELDFVGFASKDIEKAKQYAQKYQCPQYGNYQYFLDSDVDIIYIATYNLSHYQLIKDCLNANKNVICEKPMLATKQQYQEVFQLAKQHNVLIMEALKSVFLPVIIKTKQMIEQGQLGQIKYASASFLRGESFPSDHYIYDLATGGATRDLGTYCVGTLNYILGKKPTYISHKWDRTKDKAEMDCQLKLDYQGIDADINVSFINEQPSYLLVQGDKGSIRIDNFWKNNKAILTIGNKETIVEEEMISDFYYEIKHFVNLVAENKKESDVMTLQFCLDMINITSR